MFPTKKTRSLTMHFNIKLINDIKTTNINSIVCFRGIFTDISNLCTIRRKYDSKVTKQTIHLQDLFGYNMDVIFWGRNFDVVSQEISSLCATGNNPIITIKSSHVGELNGKFVVTTTRSIILVGPNI